ncbi:MAG: transketolase [Candidatus Abyssobacteria bacterium SURF_5]|uniref:Transketolase n=1 Tax=Abyssobacteria bacterium (strain SURF_5) TaxID=2093360 RepID=A0A3A4NJC5_ABYX5|nr:MAG: transketolase [Candidatus Abyssubacteria bacterium SURF_5]
MGGISLAQTTTKHLTDRKELEKFLKRKVADAQKKVLELARIAMGGHLGGGLSMIDVTVALYHHVMNIDPANPAWPHRDRFILSKGHGAIALDAILAQVGYFPEDKLETFNKLDSPFGMHTNAHSTPGIEHSTGSLGHGLSVAVGMALGARLDRADWRVFCLLGDGELQEGSVWEAFMSGSHYKLGNLIAVIDRNGFSLDGRTEEVMALEPLAEKLRAFQWNVLEVGGHDMAQLLNIFNELPPPSSETPTAIIANTEKGHGVSFMVNNAKWHYGAIDSDLEAQAIKEIDASVAEA